MDNQTTDITHFAVVFHYDTTFKAITLVIGNIYDVHK